MNAQLVQMCERLCQLSALLPSDDAKGCAGTNENRTYMLGQITMLSGQIQEVASNEAQRLIHLGAQGLKPLQPE